MKVGDLVIRRRSPGEVKPDLDVSFDDYIGRGRNMDNFHILPLSQGYERDAD